MKSRSAGKGGERREPRGKGLDIEGGEGIACAG